MENEKLKDRVDSHENKLTKIETVVVGLSKTQDKMADGLTSIALSLQKQEVIYEKFINLEVNTKDEFNRVYTKIEEHKEYNEGMFKRIWIKLTTLEPVVFLFKYHKITALVALGFYSLTFKEIRDSIILKVLEFLG